MIEFYLTCIGITIIITQSSILEKFRNKVSSMGDFFDELIHCAMCSGFWVGAVMALIYGNDLISSAAISSLTSWLTFTVANLLYSITNYLLNKQSEYEEN